MNLTCIFYDILDLFQFSCFRMIAGKNNGSLLFLKVINNLQIAFTGKVMFRSVVLDRKGAVSGKNHIGNNTVIGSGIERGNCHLVFYLKNICSSRLYFP